MISVLMALCWHTSLRSFSGQNEFTTMGERYCQLILVHAFQQAIALNLIAHTIIFNSIDWVESRNRWMQTSEISNVRVWVEACILIVSSHPSGCDLNPGSDTIEQVGWLDTMGMHDSTRTWMFEMSDVCVRRVRDSTQWVLLKMIEIECNCWLKSMAL